MVTESGFIKSRHLDDKASSAVLLTLAREVAEGRVVLPRRTYIVSTVYEEVGHGAAPLSKLDLEDMLAVDMGCVGDDLVCKENMVSICAKDSAGPYDYDFTSELVALAEEKGLPYAVDIYPSYSSDASAALRAGLDARFALCGQGVYASHGYERSARQRHVGDPKPRHSLRRKEKIKRGRGGTAREAASLREAPPSRSLPKSGWE